MAFIGKLDETDASRLASIEPKGNDNYRPPQSHQNPPAPSYQNQNQRNSQPSSYLYQQRAPSQPNHMIVIIN